MNIIRIEVVKSDLWVPRPELWHDDESYRDELVHSATTNSMPIPRVGESLVFEAIGLRSPREWVVQKVMYLLGEEQYRDNVVLVMVD